VRVLELSHALYVRIQDNVPVLISNGHTHGEQVAT